MCQRCLTIVITLVFLSISYALAYVQDTQKPCYCTLSELSYFPNLSSHDVLTHTALPPHIIIVPDYVATLHPHRLRAQHLLRTTSDTTCPCDNQWTHLEGIPQTPAPTASGLVRPSPGDAAEHEPALCARSGRLPRPLLTATQLHREAKSLNRSASPTTARRVPQPRHAPAPRHEATTPTRHGAAAHARAQGCGASGSCAGYTVVGCTLRPPGAGRAWLQAGRTLAHGSEGGAHDGGTPQLRLPSSVVQRDPDMMQVDRFRVRVNMVSGVLAVLRVLTWVMG